jgi:hypothetical protein
MPTETRRRLLKGLALTLPAAWSRPIVESVVLPAHAQTSGPGCSADAGCYSLSNVEFETSFQWPGGGGAQMAEIFNGTECGDAGEGAQWEVVLAASLAEAQDAAGACRRGYTLQAIDTVPAPPEGCRFYMCLPIN